MMTNTCHIVEEGINPSSDYFVIPALEEFGARIVRHDWQHLPSAKDLEGSFVIFVRYLPRNWRSLIKAARSSLAGVVYFMDDDLFDTQSSNGLPWRYRFKLARLATSQQGWLQRTNATVWVSTPWLQEKYRAWQPRLILPKPLAAPQPRPPGKAGPSSPRRVFYHGSASHTIEIQWLAPIMQSVLEQDSRIEFELTGTDKVRKIFRGIPRVTVHAPMKWPAYQVFQSQPGRHIGLAPLLDHPFNAARSYTKFFDITQTGAAGIYAQSGPWSHLVNDREHGLLVRMDPKAWINSILALADADAMRARIVTQAQSLVDSLHHRAPREEQM